MFKKGKKKDSAEVRELKAKIENLELKEKLKKEKSEKAAIGASFGILLFLVVFIVIAMS